MLILGVPTLGMLNTNLKPECVCHVRFSDTFINEMSLMYQSNRLNTAGIYHKQLHVISHNGKKIGEKDLKY